jgi:hypothetical protein
MQDTVRPATATAEDFRAPSRCPAYTRRETAARGGLGDSQPSTPTHLHVPARRRYAPLAGFRRRLSTSQREHLRGVDSAAAQNAATPIALEREGPCNPFRGSLPKQTPGRGTLPLRSNNL